MSVGAQVVEALKAALPVRLSEENISQVWEALGELIGSGALVRRPNGTWTTVDASSLLL